MTKTSLPKRRNNIDQDQFLTILSREEALERFEAALFPREIPVEQRRLAEAVGCTLAIDIVSPIDVPPFDRSNVDGFAVRSTDLASAAEFAPVHLTLNQEVIDWDTAHGATLNLSVTRFLRGSTYMAMRDYPAALHVKVMGMNALGKVYTLDRNYTLTK